MKSALLKGQIFGLLLAGLLMGGCSTTKKIPLPRPKRIINVKADNVICQQSVIVHVVGVNSNKKRSWEKMSMTDYWQGEKQSQARRNREMATKDGLVWQIRFGTGRGDCTDTLGKKDPIRKRWRGKNVKYLFVLADLPGFRREHDAYGDDDPRRRILPDVGSDRWKWNQKTIHIEIRPQGIEADFYKPERD